MSTKKAKRLWHLGNTTVRNPFRIKGGLEILVGSPLHGNLIGNANENLFARILADKGIVSIVRPDSDASDLGRKWRAAFSQLGLISAAVDDKHGSQDWIGPAYTVTASGRRLLEATSGPAIQECFLRVLSAYCIPSPLEPRYDFDRFNPLRHVIRLIQAIGSEGLQEKLTWLEMSTILPLTDGSSDLGTVAKQIRKLRFQYDHASNKREFRRSAIACAAQKYGYKLTTFYDYADLTSRYLKATGLFVADGRGIAIAPERQVLANLLAAQTGVATSDKEYLQQLAKGGELPTDDVHQAKHYLDSLVETARARGIPVDIGSRARTSAADISNLTHEVEAAIFRDKESEFASEQANQWKEIVHYMDALLTGRSVHGKNAGEERLPISVPKDERAAYLEWVLWRAFLAMDSLVNEPGDARNFNVDQEFLPMGCAAGGQPDMVFEFDNFVVVCEVTLMTSSRQEAAEGEPVRRHVADVLRRYGESKPVYGLFVATTIDSNTAETFRIGSWYLPDDTRLSLNVVPLMLKDFRDFFEAIFEANKVDVKHILALLNACCANRARVSGAPEWKEAIGKQVGKAIKELSHIDPNPSG